VLGLVMFAYTIIANTAMKFGDTNVTEDGWAKYGGAMCLLWLVACGVAIEAPLATIVLFAIASIVGFTGSADYPTLMYWAAASFALACLSILGWREKQAVDEEARLRFQQMERLIAGRATPAPSPPETGERARAPASVAGWGPQP